MGRCGRRDVCSNRNDERCAGSREGGEAGRVRNYPDNLHQSTARHRTATPSAENGTAFLCSEDAGVHRPGVKHMVRPPTIPCLCLCSLRDT